MEKKTASPRSLGFQGIVAPESQSTRDPRMMTDAHCQGIALNSQTSSASPFTSPLYASQTGRMLTDTEAGSVTFQDPSLVRAGDLKLLLSHRLDEASQ